MIPADIPFWLAIVVGALAIAGAGLTLIGSVGLARLGDFYQRIHAPTLGSSLGSGLVLFASVMYFSVTGQRWSVHEMLIFLFVTLTTPVTLVLLARAALYRDRLESQDRDAVPEIPPRD